MIGVDRRDVGDQWRRWRGVTRSGRPTVRLVLLVGFVCSAGAVIAFETTVHLLQSPPHGRRYAELAVFLVLAAVAERYPFPVENAVLRIYSLAAIFNIAGIVLFGWEPIVVVSVLGLVLAGTWLRRPLISNLYSVATLIVAASSAGLLLGVLPSWHRLFGLVAAICVAAFGYVVPGFLFITGAFALSEGKRYGEVLEQTVRWGFVPLFLAVSASLMTVVLWQRSPFMIAALAGPMAVIDMYERQRHKARSAMQLATTDALTGLNNARRFHERLQQALDEAESTQRSLALCFFDLDNLKEVNDEHGHPAGDRVLVTVASRLRHGGEAFRLGGDEFAVLLSGRSSEEAVEIAETILARVASIRVGDLPRLTMSCGIAVFPSEGVEGSELVRLADLALYWAKEHGKNRVCVYHPDTESAYALERLGSNPSLDERLRTAATLADAVDARDAHTGAHSRRVGDLAALVGERLGLKNEDLELLRLAGHLHDVGKLAIPEELLRKQGPLSGTELIALQRHPEIGFQMLEGLGLGSVAEWVLHHHERWDGLGYPQGLSGEKISLGARIIFTCDAWDSMTSERTYRHGLTVERALEEMYDRAGSQFDPEVVEALTEVLDLASDREPAVRGCD